MVSKLDNECNCLSLSWITKQGGIWEYNHQSGIKTCRIRTGLLYFREQDEIRQFIEESLVEIPKFEANSGTGLENVRRSSV